MREDGVKNTLYLVTQHYHQSSATVCYPLILAIENRVLQQREIMS